MARKNARNHYRTGLTLIEILIVTALIAIFAGFGLISLLGRRSKTEVESTARQIVGLLREAQSHSMSQSSSTGWGVRFSNATDTVPFYAMFAGSSYAPSGETGHYRLPERVFYVTSTIASGAVKDVSFSQITGAPSTSTTVGIVGFGGTISSTISISSSGLINF